MESKLGLNFELVNQARASAAKVADDTQRFIDQHTTVTVERAVCRLLGIDGVNDMDVPMPNVVVDHLMANSILPMGAAWAIGNAMVETGKDPQGVAEAVTVSWYELGVPGGDTLYFNVLSTDSTLGGLSTERETAQREFRANAFFISYSGRLLTAADSVTRPERLNRETLLPALQKESRLVPARCQAAVCLRRSHRTQSDGNLAQELRRFAHRHELQTVARRLELRLAVSRDCRDGSRRCRGRALCQRREGS